MRPRCAIGHIGPLPVSSVPTSVAFYAGLGMRQVMATERMAILELRGGTHLILRQAPIQANSAPFDLMVDDVHALRDELLQSGSKPSSIRHGGVHRTFDLTDPDGRRVSVTSSHAIGPV